MLILLSPSKTQDFSSKAQTYESSHIDFLNESREIMQVLKRLHVEELQKIMKMSEKIAVQTKVDIDAFNSPKQLSLSKPALCAYTGEVFRQFELDKYSKDDFYEAQRKIVILSGLYGVLKPLDLIEPYRLEMQAKLSIGSIKNLYDFWRDRITDYLNTREKECIVNLASQEYFSAIDTKKVEANIVSPIFLTQKDGDLKNIAIHAKKARGLMANWCVRNRVNKVDDLKRFQEGGYVYQEEKSDEEKLVFGLISAEDKITASFDVSTSPGKKDCINSFKALCK